MGDRRPNRRTSSVVEDGSRHLVHRFSCSNYLPSPGGTETNCNTTGQHIASCLELASFTQIARKYCCRARCKLCLGGSEAVWRTRATLAQGTQRATTLWMNEEALRYHDTTHTTCSQHSSMLFQCWIMLRLMRSGECRPVTHPPRDRDQS